MQTSSDDLLQKAFENSLQANIICIVAGGRVVRANRAACRLLGYSQKELLTKSRADIFQISEAKYKKMLRQRTMEGGARSDLSVIRKNGRLWPCEITSVVFKDADGVMNSITSIVDRRERLSVQKKIDDENERSRAENDAWIKSIGNTTYDVTWDWDIIVDEISFGRNYERVFGYKLPVAKVSFEKWMEFFLPEERDSMKRKVQEILESKKRHWLDNFEFVCPDGSLAHVDIRSNIIRDDRGTAIRLIGVIHDISKMEKLSEDLDREIRVKKTQITEAIVEAKEMERSDLGKELHDNVNQLLVVSMLYLDMAKKDINNAEIYLIHSSEYTSSAIEEIRKLTRGLVTDTIRNFGLCAAIEHISQETMDVSPVKIHCILDPSLEKPMSDKFKLNAFRIIQEQLNNILKHAKATSIHITMSAKKAAFSLSITDNGIGFNNTSKLRQSGIGIGNIISRAEFYRGRAKFITEPGNGCKLIVTFPKTRQL